MVRYSFLVQLAHPLLYTGLSRRILDHLIRPEQHRLRNRQIECFRRLQIDDKLELRWLLDWEICRPRALQDFVHVDSYAPVAVREVPAVGHEPAGLYSCSADVCRR